ncbi:MAG: rhomboid family intramembrane serine protease [Desulfovibrionaceae bacterium]
MGSLPPALIRLHSHPMPFLFRRSIAPRRRPPLWLDLAVLVNGIPGLDPEELRLWALVLEARRIPCRLRREAGERELQVRRMDAERAEKEIRLWQEENSHGASILPVPESDPADVWPPALFMLLLVFFHALTGRAWPLFGLYRQRWLDIGSAHGASIMEGEWWRLSTALTLHADAGHVLGNALVGGLFLALAGRRTGGGLALLVAVAGGVLGNLWNALALGPHHDSIGFSTAVFAAAGLLAALGVLEGRGAGLLRALIPVGAGLGLLAMLGAGGENTDLGAHLFGFTAGLILGLPASLAVLRWGRPSLCWGATFYLLVLLALSGCWAMALSA